MANCRECGRQIDNPKFKLCRTCTNKLPDKYLAKGYFDEKGNLWPELLLEHASNIAEKIGLHHKMGSAQLRRFYGHAKSIFNRLNYYIEDFDLVKPEIQKLIPFAAEAKGKDKIPLIFFEFFQKNISQINDPDGKKKFIKGFMEHFQAVVAFFSYHYPSKN